MNILITLVRFLNVLPLMQINCSQTLLFTTYHLVDHKVLVNSIGSFHEWTASRGQNIILYNINQFSSICGFPKVGVSPNGLFIMESRIKIDDLGVPPMTQETPIFSHFMNKFWSPGCSVPGFGRSAACSFGHGRGVSSLGDFSGRRGGLGDPIPKEMIFF